MLASYTRGGWVVGVRILLLNDIFLSLNSLNSVKTFRKNSNESGVGGLVECNFTEKVYGKVKSKLISANTAYICKQSARSQGLEVWSNAGLGKFNSK